MSKTSSELTSPFAAALTPPAGAEGIRDALRGKYVCPFCGSVNDSDQGTCPRCTMENSAATRKATKTRIGPWYVLQTRNPAAPGMTWDTLVGFVRKGRVKPRSIVRGPTTHQLWRFAAHVKGLSREFGICYSCGTAVEVAASVCRTCNRLQDPPPNPDALLETSREAAPAGLGVGLPPSAVAGAVPPTLVGTVVADVPPPPEDAEFVIPPLDGGRGAGDGLGGGGGAPATPYAGLSGDTSWARIPPNAPRDANGREGSGADRGGMDRGPSDRGGPYRNGADRGAGTAGGPNGFGPAGQAGGGRAAGGRGANGMPAAQPQAPRFNPDDDSDDPAAGGRRGDGDAGFLSPKELAAAFNLSFVGEDEESPVYQTVRPGQGGRGGAAPANPARGPAAAGAAGRNAPAGRGNAASPAVAAAAMAATFGGAAPGPANAARAVRPPAEYQPRRSRLFIFVMLLLLAGAGVFVALAVSADFRKVAKDWFAKVTAALNKTNDGDQLGSPGSKRSKVDKGAGGDPARLPGDAGEPDATPSPASGGAATQPARTGSPADGSPPAPASPSGAAVPGRPDAAVPTVASPDAPLAASPVAAAPIGLPAKEWMKTEEFETYKEVFRLEAGDPALALAKLKAIKRGPPERRPSDLDARIKRLDDRLKKMAPE